VHASVVPAGTSFAERASVGHARSDETEWPIPLVDKRTLVRYNRGGEKPSANRGGEWSAECGGPIRTAAFARQREHESPLISTDQISDD